MNGEVRFYQRGVVTVEDLTALIHLPSCPPSTNIILFHQSLYSDLADLLWVEHMALPCRVLMPRGER